MYMGKPDEAAAELANITKKARNDGERRNALFGLTVLHVDGGKMAKALAEVDKQYALGEKTSDVPAMAGDQQLKGNILLEMGKAAEAKAAFERGLKMTEDSTLSRRSRTTPNASCTTASRASRSSRRTWPPRRPRPRSFGKEPRRREIRRRSGSPMNWPA
jgi:tetratricopeptide (TPR) repeat protein